MATALVRPRGRLKFADFLELEGTFFYDLIDYPEIPEQPDDTSYTVMDHDRIDSIAYKFYGEDALWWIIAIANGVERIPEDLNSGDIIRIPSNRFVTQEFLNRNRRVSR